MFPRNLILFFYPKDGCKNDLRNASNHLRGYNLSQPTRLTYEYEHTIWLNGDEAEAAARSVNRTWRSGWKGVCRGEHSRISEQDMEKWMEGFMQR
jgi:hypothetical protein